MSEYSLSNNGYIMCGIYLPSEIIAVILSFVDDNSLIEKSRFVCKQWNALIKTIVWKLKAERNHSEIFKDLKLTKRLPWSVYHSIARTNVFGRNLLKNNCGQNGFEHWRLTRTNQFPDHYGGSTDGDKWKIESPPIGVPDVLDTDNHRSCFVTSYMKCVKDQLIDLCKEGVHPDILDKFQPDIFISEFFAPRWDCCSYYEIKVKLLDEEKNTIKRFDFNEKMQPVTHGWKEVNHTFQSYGPGVRYILFIHAGKDLQFWAGHYGSKMTDARIEIPLYTLNRLQISYNDSYEC